MSEAEDVVTDVARLATVHARALWRRHRPPVHDAPAVDLDGLLPRLDLLVSAAFDHHLALRAAEPPARPTLLARLFDRGSSLRPPGALPGTDGHTIWLPRDLGTTDPPLAHERLRVLALQQAARAARGSAAALRGIADARVRAYFEVLEANAADALLVSRLPGLRVAVERLRRDALAARPAPHALAAAHRLLEAWLQDVLAAPVPASAITGGPERSLACAFGFAGLAARGGPAAPGATSRRRTYALQPDLWIGELRAPRERAVPAASGEAADSLAASQPHARTARLPRRPRVRDAEPDEDDGEPGLSMVQTSHPHEHAEDPLGLQRPTDRDEQTAAEGYADSLAELDEARLVSTPGTPRENLVGDDPPPPPGRGADARPAPAATLAYPEWDHRIAGYRTPGAILRLLEAAHGSPEWVERTLAEHRGLLQDIRRRFESLRARPVRLRRQYDGDDVDLDAWTAARADFRAGLALSQALYTRERRGRREVAVALLVDVSGSTDAWISAQRRIVDVEREALLLVCNALEALGEPYLVQAFSGDGAPDVSVRTLKRFDERYGAEVALRIAGLEPERYTRAGGALRHATALLMREPARHRLLLLLSDGKPNDVDAYEGRYGVEDVRQAVVEARLQGVQPFCLTVDRQASAYLPRIFGPGHYALLTRPERLPVVLLEWTRRLVTA